MVKLIDGKKIAQRIYDEIRPQVQLLHPIPRLAIVLASEDEGSYNYVNLKSKKANELGIETKLYQFPKENSSKQALIHEIKRFEKNEAVTGVLIQLPFFNHLKEDTNSIVNTLFYGKDADGLTGIQQGLSSHFIEGSIPPATVEAILECLNECFDENLTWNNLVVNHNKINSLQGKNILIINNSNLIGKPLAAILSSLGATITIANSKTSNLAEFSQKADIIVSATGQTNIINHEMIKNGSILIDVTSSKVGDKILGDFIISDELKNKASYLTPVPGGVGPLTVACLLRNVVRLAS